MTPSTELDARFSEPGASATSWADALRVLESAELFWITTVRADGRPHVSPLVAVWLDDAVHFSTGAQEQKAINVRTNPHVILTTGCNDWQHGLDVVVEGEAVRTTDDATLQRLADAYREKWDRQWQYEVHDGAFRSGSEARGGAAGAGREAIVFSVAPTKVLAFGKSPFTQTRHRF
jgi:general stress protein 26